MGVSGGLSILTPQVGFPALAPAIICTTPVVVVGLKKDSWLGTTLVVVVDAILVGGATVDSGNRVERDRANGITVVVDAGVGGGQHFSLEQ